MKELMNVPIYPLFNDTMAIWNYRIIRIIRVYVLPFYVKYMIHAHPHKMRAEPSTWHRRSSPKTGWFLSGAAPMNRWTDEPRPIMAYIWPMATYPCLWRRNPPVWCGSRWLRSYGASCTGPQGQSKQGCLLDQSVRVARVLSLENGSIMTWKLKSWQRMKLKAETRN